MEPAPISESWINLFRSLNESQRRWAAGVKAVEIGYGGISKVSRVTGLSRTTITRGMKEINDVKYPPGSDEIRKSGSGRKAVLKTDKVITEELEKILSETTAGDPMSRLIWTSKSVRKIATELTSKGYSISHSTVQRILHELDYSLQSNRKSLSQASNPNRDDQFRHINATVNAFIEANQPVVSVDTKKKELVGKFLNKGKRWRKKGVPDAVEDHDFRSRAHGVAIPYGTYDVQRNEGFVSVGTTIDTAEFAVNSIKQWWHIFGRKHYGSANKLLICADGGGSNGSRNRLWKLSLQKLARQLNLEITVCHYPPGTSKWNKIEHKLFSYISLNWKGKPLESYETIVNFIGNTSTQKGLKVKAKIDKREYQKGKKVTDEEFDIINIEFHKKFPKWNYTIRPNQ